MAIKSLIINPGSTSTKIGVFEDETLLFEETLRHSTEEIAQYASIVDQKDFRKEIITNLLAAKDFDILAGILSRYVLLGMTKGTLWNEGTYNGVFLNLILKMKEIVEFWSMDKINV